MAATTVSVQSRTSEGIYGIGLDSLYSFDLMPQVYGEVVSMYGKGFGLRQMLHLAGKEINISGRTITLIEKGSLEKAVTLDVVSTGIYIAAQTTGGGDISIKPVTADADYLSIGDTVFIPASYTNRGGKGVVKFQVTAESSGVYTCKPFDNTITIPSDVTAQLTLMASGGNFAPGSQGAAAKRSAPFYRTFVTAIKRAGFAVQGGATATDRYSQKLIGGGQGAFTQASLEADMFLDSAMNDELFVGEENSNTSLTLATEYDGNVAARGTKGLWRHLEEGGMKLTHTGGSFARTDLYDAKDLLLSQGVVDTTAYFGVAPTLYRYIETMGLTFLQDYSGGSNLITALGDAGVKFRSFLVGGVVFVLQELVNFANPNKYGATGNWDENGFIIPDTMVTVQKGDLGSPLTLSNLVIGYLNANGENRTRIVKVRPGVEGITGDKIAVSSYDNIQGEMLTEFALIVLKRNQMIQVISA